MLKRLLLTLIFLFGIKAFSAEINNYSSNSADMAVLSNFRIENSNKDRVYFDSSIPLSHSNPNVNGFIISGKTVKSIEINETQTTGHYFIVSSPFTFWDNNTIRYEGGSDLKVINFTLQYILNKIQEPKANKKVYYVSTTGNDKNNGLSESRAFRTINKAVKNALPGTTVWVKAGNYGKEKISFSRSGMSNAPIKVIGYKNKIGDISSNYYQYRKGKKLNPSEMPMLDGGNRAENTAISFPRSKYIIVRNFQVQNYLNGFYGNVCNAIKVENSIGLNFGSIVKQGRIFVFSTKSKRVTLKNNIAINSTMHNILINGSYNLIIGCKSYGNDLRNAAWATDYWFAIAGNYNISKNTYAYRDGNLPHTGHGFSIDTSGGTYDTKYNLIEDHEAVNFGKSLELRGGAVAFNLIRNHTTYKDDSRLLTGGLMLRDGTHDNVIENAHIYNTSVALPYAATKEVASGTAYRNTFVNSIFVNCNKLTYPIDDVDKPEFRKNRFINCTFYNIKKLIDTDRVTIIKENEFINCNLVNVKSGGDTKGYVFKYCNFYGGFKKTGNNNISVNPKFVNPSKRNFKLSTGSRLIDKGIKVGNFNNTDFSGLIRPQGDGIDIGAFEYEEKTTSQVQQVKVNAGEDIEICSGNTVTLTAEGGSEFLWSTGAKTKSIEVSPNETTTYTVNNGSTSDSVIVTVNSLPSFSLGADKEVFKGDSVEIEAPSGFSSYKWSNGSTNRVITVTPDKATTYSVEVENSNGCIGNDQITINVKVKADGNPSSQTIQVNAGEDIEICLGNTVTLTAEGGSEFLWSTGAKTKSIEVSPNETTTYTVNNGSTSDSVIVTVNSLPSVSLGADKEVFKGDSVVLEAPAGYSSYQWSNGATTQKIVLNPKKNVTYSVTVKNSKGCSASDEISIKVYERSKVIVSDDITICSGETATISAKGADNYLWSTGETASSIKVEPVKTTNYSLRVEKNGEYETYNIIVFVKNDCSSLEEELTLYPNPTSGEIKLKAKGYEGTVNLYLVSASGAIVYREYISDVIGQEYLNRNLDLSSYSSGVYFFKLQNEQKIQTKKIVLR